jgi:hypothetical protein
MILVQKHHKVRCVNVYVSKADHPACEVSCQVEVSHFFNHEEKKKFCLGAPKKEAARIRGLLVTVLGMGLGLGKPKQIFVFGSV